MQSKIIGITTILAVIASIFLLFLLTDFSSTFQSSKSEQTSSQSTINPYVKEYSLPHGTWPNGILVDKNGSIWVAGSEIHHLFRFDPQEEKIVETFPLTTQNEQSDVSRMVWTMIEDNEGMIWLSQMGPEPIWRFNPHTKKFDIFYAESSPFQMKADNYGNIWFTTLNANTIGIIQKTIDEPQYKITEFELDSDSLPSGIFLEGEQVWITTIKDNALVKFHPERGSDDLIIDINKILQVPITTQKIISSPTDMVILENSTIWVPEHGTSFVSKFHSNLQEVTRFPTSQNQYKATSLPFWLKEAEDGKGFWFNEHTGNKIGFFDTEKMELIEYDIPSRPSDGFMVFPLNIVTDPSNSDLLWFSEWNTDKIGVVDKSIPLPFEIIPDNENTTIQNNSGSAILTINFIKKEEYVGNHVDTTVTLNASSSIELNGGLGNMTARFSTDSFDLTRMKEKENVNILLTNIPLGKHTIAVSATNGIVTKSIFFELINGEYGYN